MSNARHWVALPTRPALREAWAATSAGAPDLPPPGGPRGMQSARGGAPRPGHADRLPAALLMLLLDRDRPEPVRSGAHELALFLTPEPGAEVEDGGVEGPEACVGVEGSRARASWGRSGRVRALRGLVPRPEPSASQ